MDNGITFGKIVGGFVAATVAILALFGLLGSWFIIDQGERGVVLRNGAFVRIAEPGLGFKLPIVDSVVDLSVRTEKHVYDKMMAYSQDIQLAELRVSVNYRLDAGKVRQVYENFGNRAAAVDRVLTPRVYDETKVVFGTFNADNAVKKRDKLGVDMLAALRKSVGDAGIFVESIQVENIDFSKAFEQSIEDRMKAEVEVAKLEQNLRREQVQADIVRTQANGRADAIRAEAKAQADAIQLRGEAEAKAILARADALKKNAELIELVKAERWDGKLPVTMIPQSAVPFVNVK